MEIKRYAWDTVDSNSWLIVENNCGLLFDAIDNAALYAAVRDLDELMIVITHAHFDHICGLNHLRNARPDATVIGTDLCSTYLGNKFRNMSSTANIFLTFYRNGEHRTEDVQPFTCDPVNESFTEKKRLSWQGHDVSLISVHGHSADGLIGILDHTWLFSGDTLLSIPTITKFLTGSTEKFWTEDVPLLRSLANEIETVYPGHGLPGPISDMLQINKRPVRYRHA